MLSRIRTEYSEAQSFLENKKQRWVNQLRLLDNLERGEENIASTMLFSYITRIHSNLYSPNIQIKFEPNQDSEVSNVEMLNKLAGADFQEMNMSVVEYDWLWDALFFGRGYVETLNFDKKRKIMVPTVLNPLMFGYDPMFSDVQNWRYYWKWITRSSSQIKRLIKQGIITGIKSPSEISSGMEEQVWQYKVTREEARDVDPQGPDSQSVQDGGNNVYQILEHYTIVDGVKTVFWVDKGFTKILREEKLDLKDDVNDETDCLWPIVPREVFREPHSSVPLSVPDLIEDKHRAKNVILNLAYIAAKDEVTPLFVYKEDHVSNPAQLLQRQIMQHISIEEEGDVNNTIAPLRKNNALSNSTLSFLNILGNEAADAVGTTQITPPMQKGKKSATGEALQQMVADLVGSLQSRVIGNSEKDFWTHWYQRYVNNTQDGDIKVVRVTNAQFTTFESIQLKDIKTELPPKATIFSSKEAQFKEAVERRELSQQFGVLQSVLPPERMSMFLKYVWFPKFETFDRETIDLILPKSQDEIKAEEENEMIAKGILPPISEGDNHEVHLYIHGRVKNNAEKWAHYLTHQKLLADQQKAKAAAAQADSTGENTQGKDGKQPSKSMLPEEAATPNKGNTEKVGKTLAVK